MKVLVTGTAGFIGYHLALKLLEYRLFPEIMNSAKVLKSKFS